MSPSASATCVAVRSWCASSSSARRSGDAPARRAVCTAYEAPALAPSVAKRAFRPAKPLATKLGNVSNAKLVAAGAPVPYARNPIGHGMCAPTIVVHGSDEQKRRYLRPLFTSEEIWCQMFSEPGAGSDVASLSTRAVRDGDEWIMNGQKVWTTLAHVARFGIILVRTDADLPKHKGMTMFVIDMHEPAVEVRP